MDKFLIKQPRSSSGPSVSSHVAPEAQRETITPSSSNVDCILGVGSLKRDPGERKPIFEYDSNIQDVVRRHYILMGPYQPKLRVYPKTTFGTSNRQFSPEWFNAPNSAWLEYSIDDDAIFCLCCYLFKNEFESRGNAKISFTQDGFKTWNHGPERIRLHVGEVNSIHNKCLNRMLDFANQRQSIQSSIHKQSEKTKSDYRIRLNASIDVVRFLLRNGLPFRGHDESEDSDYKGLFLELLKFHGVNRPDVEKVILQHAPKNDMMICSTIQKEIVDACTKETIKAIIKDLDGDYFGILVDESKDISHKEQMALVLRYVNKNEELIESFLGIVHVGDTSARSLQKVIYSLLLDHSLCLSRLRGQGYDGASNMQEEKNGLKSLIFQDASSAYYIHCFAHQLQLTLVALSKKHPDVKNFFYVVTNVLNIIGSSFKRRDLLQQHQVEKLEELLKSGEILTGQGLNQERGIQRPGDTRWASYFKTLENFMIIFSSIANVLKDMKENSPHDLDKLAVGNLLDKIQEFEFIFVLHLMFKMLLLTNELNKALQKKD
ncbi:hypothetical protein R3W88_028692 [Solanum pinnatisectum]|uniref:TTF-type domain-containing protein n=1 Tax=Solanum pinnatisectum TaxID=50273 RepID=A0AAV9K3F8_9SOLN|nr:hypothetical protein R3W88_028692 [Solanum pinnatisectum]